jgi:molybdenum cofactor cytidylyltransferase
MLSSIQAGLVALGSGTRAALIGLGDQPQVREETIRHICTAFVQTESPIVIPSFQSRRGHPWLATKPLWPEILGLPLSTTPRQFLDTHAEQIEYVAADKSILQDLDTPEDYKLQRP